MKKLVIASALLLGGFSSFAETPVVFHDGIMESVMLEEYTEIKVSELPQAVQDAFKKDFPEATIDKAYVNESKTYKLEVTTTDLSTTLYATENGEWIDE